MPDNIDLTRIPFTVGVDGGANDVMTVVDKTTETTDGSLISPTENRQLGITKGYPKSEAPLYKTNGPHGPNQFAKEGGFYIKTIDHIRDPIEPHDNEPQKVKFLVRKPAYHFTRDVQQNISNKENQMAMVRPEEHINDPMVFSGSTTHINPTGDKDKQDIINSGSLSKYLEEDFHNKELGNYAKPPLSPIHPFFRMNDINNQQLADQSLYNSYNRTRIPIADAEWRKGFRYIFITRPECYILGLNGNNDTNKDRVDISEQAEFDEDFQSAWSRIPHILRILSPWYVSGSFPNFPEGSNWNMLFSNRAQGLSVQPSTLSFNENVSKSIEGFTVSPGAHVESRQGSTIELNFLETKRLEVYEMARLWMLYIYKRKKGIFIPPYNGYQIKNGFIDTSLLSNPTDDESPTPGLQMSSGADGSISPYYTRFHPYDRALEYCASLYDIITNEAGTKILYWCKYYGIYPTQASPALANEENNAMTKMNTTITFKYHYRLENTNKILVEFNHDAGLTDDIGRIKPGVVTNSMPFLLRNSYDDPIMKKYVGASGMFTGSPYIVMMKSRPDPLKPDKTILEPNLRFMNINDLKLDGNLNMNITNVDIDQKRSNVIAYK